MRSRDENPAAFWLLLCAIGAVVGLMACAIASRNDDADDDDEPSAPAKRDTAPKPELSRPPANDDSLPPATE